MLCRYESIRRRVCSQNFTVLKYDPVSHKIIYKKCVLVAKLTKILGIYPQNNRRKKLFFLVFLLVKVALYML